jgi:predicted amidohydrolase YtcJ
MLAPFDAPDGSVVDPDDTGIWVTEPEQLAELTTRAAAAGLATQIHGIGDAAVRAALDAFEPSATRSLPFRARIEHAQLVDPADLPRFGRLGIVVSIQPVHLRSDAEQARRSWGARAERSAYAWASLLRAGATLAFGTDAPVEPIDPWPGIALAMSRRSPEWPAGTPAFGPGEALSLDAVLRAACLGPAEAEGSVDRGRLTVGQRADVVVIGADLSSHRPRLVLIDGRVAFDA